MCNCVIFKSIMVICPNDDDINFNSYYGSKVVIMYDAPPSSLMDSVASPKVKTMEGKGVRASSLTRNTLGVEGCDGPLRWGLGGLTSNSITHTNLPKPNNELVSE
jgi:hypothetical protein